MGAAKSKVGGGVNTSFTMAAATVTLFQGWFYLLSFGAASVLVVANADEASRAGWRADLVISTLAAVWLSVELIWVPQSVFGKTLEHTSFIRVLRYPWKLSMGVLSLVASCGAESTTDLVGVPIPEDTFVSIRALVATVGALGVVTGSIEVWQKTTRHEWGATSQQEGWVLKRWYEGGQRPQHAEGFKYLNLGLVILLVACPITSVVWEFVEGSMLDLKQGRRIQRSVMVTAIVCNLLSATLISLAALYATVTFREGCATPVHLGPVLAHWFLMSRTDAVYCWMVSLLPLAAYITSEAVYGNFNEHLDALGSYVTQRRTWYRLCYVIAVWSGVFAVVAWGIGWSGEWISLDVDAGVLVRSLIDSLDHLEVQLGFFLHNIWKVIDFLTICNRLPEDATLTNVTFLDNVLNGVADEALYISGRVSFGDVEVTTYGDEADYVYFDIDETKDKLTRCSLVAHGLCFNRPLDEACADPGDTFIRDVVFGQADSESVIINSTSSKAAGSVYEHVSNLQDGAPISKCILTNRVAATDGDDLVALGEFKSAVATRSQGMGESLGDPLTDGCLSPPCSESVCAADPLRWTDAAEQTMQAGLPCLNLQCGLFTAAMAGGTAAAFIPFAGGAISFAVKTAARIAWKILSVVRKYKITYMRARRKRKRLREATNRLRKVLLVGKAAKAAAKKGVQANYTLLYVSFPLFAASFLSVFTGFWKRADAGASRSSLRGLLVGVGVATCASLVLLIYIPDAISVIATGLRNDVLTVNVVVLDGWRWMQVGFTSSIISCIFWVIATFLGDDSVDTPSNDSSEVLGGGQQSVVPLSTRIVARSGLKKRGLKSRSTVSWISILIWVTPGFVVACYGFYHNTPVFEVRYQTNADVIDSVGGVAAFEHSQEAVVSLQDDDETLCAIVGRAVAVLLESAFGLIGQTLLEAIEFLTSAFELAFCNLRIFLSELLGIQTIDILPWNWALLALAYGPPTFAFLASVVGLIVSLATGNEIRWLMSVMLMCGVSGLTSTLTMVGVASAVGAITLPIYEVTIEATPVILTSIVLNVLVIVSYVNATFDRTLPLFPKEE